MINTTQIHWLPTVKKSHKFFSPSALSYIENCATLMLICIFNFARKKNKIRPKTERAAVRNWMFSYLFSMLIDRKSIFSVVTCHWSQLPGKLFFLFCIICIMRYICSRAKCCTTWFMFIETKSKQDKTQKRMLLIRF